MLLDSMFNRAVIFTNVGNPTGIRDRADPFHVFRVYRVFYGSEIFSNGIKGLISTKSFIPLKNMGNPVSGPLYKDVLHLREISATKSLNLEEL